MIFEESEVRWEGLRLRRYCWRPAESPRGGVVLMHGLGDYLLRYEEVARFFVDRGFLCEGVDLPGHGHSHGQRGHISDWELLTGLLDESFGRVRHLTGGAGGRPGLFAHSMGAYVALDYLVRRTGEIRFAWLSSPLIRPGHGQPAWLLRLAEPLGKWFPRFPCDTGVRAVDCVTEDTPRLDDRVYDRLLHHRTTLRFGSELVRREAKIYRGALGLDDDLELLVTHGTRDAVCPYEISRELFERMPLKRKRFLPVEGERHEPLHGSAREEVFAAAGRWMEEMGEG